MSQEDKEPGCAEACAASLRTKYRPSDSVLNEYGRWKAPNEEEARKKFLSDHTHHQMFDVAAPCKDLKEFGGGVLLYFYLLRHAACLFAFLALLPGLPLVVFNGIGGWYDKADLERTMLGNFGLLSYNGRASGVNATTAAGASASMEGAVTSLFMSTVGSPAARVAGLDKTHLLVAMSALDLVGILVFFFFCLYMMAFVRATTSASEMRSTTIADYSVRVNRLPPDTSDVALKEYLTAAAAAGAAAAAAAAEAAAAKAAAKAAGKGGGEDGDGGGAGGGGKDGGQEMEMGMGPGLGPDVGPDMGMGMGGGGLMAGTMGPADTGCEVVQVELCRKVDHLIGLVLERDGVLAAGETALAVLQRSAEVYPKVGMGLEVEVLDARFRLSDLNDAIRAEQAAAETNQVVAAFVTFATPEARRRALQALPRSRMRQWRMPPHLKFNNGGLGSAAAEPVALDLSPAPEPSDIQYENLEYGSFERFVRVCATNAAKYVVLLIGFLLVSVAPALRTGLSATGQKGPSRAACDAACTYTDAAGNYVLSDANRQLYKSCDPVSGTGTLPGSPLDCEAVSACYECFCRAALNAGAYGELKYCARFDSVVAVSTLAQALAVFGVVVANMMIQYAIGWLTRQEKHHTRSREAVSTARGLFITQFVNTAFSNLVANMFLPGPAKAISGSFLGGYILTGAYADMTPNWYHDVGRPIIISTALTTAILHAKVLFLYWWRRYRASQRYSCLTQRHMNEAMAGHEFVLAEKYGLHLYVIFVIMTYSSAMPLLYVLAAIHFGTSYWTEKFELLRVCKRPLSYSNDLAVYASTTLPFAALWHLAFGIWAFSLFGTPASPVVASGFRKSLIRTMKTFGGLMSEASSLTPTNVAWRLTQNSSGHLFIAFLFCGAVLFIFFTTSGWLAAMRWLASLLGCIRDTAAGPDDPSAADASPAPEFATAVRSALLVGPSSYAIQRNPAYAFAFAEMEEFEWASQEVAAKPSGDLHPEDGPGATGRLFATGGSAAADGDGGGGGGKRTSRRQRTAAARMRAKRQAAAAAAAGWPDALLSNRVAPEPMQPPPPGQQPPQPAAAPTRGSFSAPGAGAGGSESGGSATSKTVVQPVAF